MLFGKNYRVKPLAVAESLSLVRPVLKPLYVAIDSAAHRSDFGGSLVERGANDFSPKANWTYSQGMAHVEASQAIAAASAGAFFLIADTLVAERTDKAKQRDHAGPAISGVPMGLLLRVAVNNLRHYMEADWAADPPVNRAAENIAVLTKAGVKGPWNRVVAVDVFKAMAYQSYEAFESDLKETLEAF